MKKIFIFLKIILNISYFAMQIIIGGFALIKFGIIDWFELEAMQFYTKLIIASVSLYLIFSVPYVISIIWHELGHLVFGIKARLKFISFSILKYTITKENDKLILKKSYSVPGVKGYCNMGFDENKQYDKVDITLYFMGGILFNFIFAIIFIILLIFIANIYLDIVFMSFILINAYFVLYNLIPLENKSGTNSDALHLINYYNDPLYICVLSRCHTIQNMLLNGCKMKDIDEKLLYMPDKFSNSSEILMAQLYIDYMYDKKEYDEAIKNIKIVLGNLDYTLSNTSINILKIQLIMCIFYGEYNLEMISEYWDENIKRYLDLMSNLVPQFLAVNYIYTVLIEKNENKSKKLLMQFEQLKKKINNKKDLEEAIKIISDVNERKNK